MTSSLIFQLSGGESSDICKTASRAFDSTVGFSSSRLALQHTNQEQGTTSRPVTISTLRLHNMDEIHDSSELKTERVLDELWKNGMAQINSIKSSKFSDKSCCLKDRWVIIGCVASNSPFAVSQLHRCRSATPNHPLTNKYDTDKYV